MSLSPSSFFAFFASSSFFAFFSSSSSLPGGLAFSSAAARENVRTGYAEAVSPATCFCVETCFCEFRAPSGQLMCHAGASVSRWQVLHLVVSQAVESQAVVSHVAASEEVESQAAESQAVVSHAVAPDSVVFQPRVMERVSASPHARGRACSLQMLRSVAVISLPGRVPVVRSRSSAKVPM